MSWYDPNHDRLNRDLEDLIRDDLLIHQKYVWNGDEKLDADLEKKWNSLEDLRRRLYVARTFKRAREKKRNEMKMETTTSHIEYESLFSLHNHDRKKLQSLKEIRDFNKTERKIAFERTKILRNRLKDFVSDVLDHSDTFIRFHKEKRKCLRRIARDIRSERISKEQKSQRDEERIERQRLRALKENDMKAYMELIRETKNERLHHLLRETESYLKGLGRLIAQQKRIVRVGKKDAKSKMSSKTTTMTTLDDDDDDEDSDSSSSFSPSSPIKNTTLSYYDVAHSEHHEIRRQPDMLVGGTLKDYQMRGLQWLVSLYENNLNGILADEMGLGKTIQTIALLTYLCEVYQNNGPFLIVVPLSTLSNWRHELAKWAPDLTIVVYKGIPDKRKEIQRTQMRQGKYNVLLTTYDYVMRDKAVLRKPIWQYIIVDEGHRMKNARSKFSQTLGHAYRSQHRLLLTGTPLQNNLPELWSLLNFLLPHIFNSVDNFERWFNKPFDSFGKHQSSISEDGTGEEDASLKEEEKLLIIHRLHEVMRPFLLRRVKSDVLDQLPDKVEKVIKCELSGWQKMLYRQISETGSSTIVGKSGKISSRGLSNVLMHLRKVCNHPYLFNETYEVNEDIIRSSGKVELLDRILRKLKATGHRVLIFTQMTQVMNILEAYFRYRQYAYLRLDGSTKADRRENAMHRFNAPDSPYFVFLLSTRAGGLGINLATADTVIIFDSDWNPQMDLQAQDRAHRIGQQREVRVLRLITNTPVEEKMLLRARSKLGMEKVVIQGGGFGSAKAANNKGKNSEVIREILRESKEMIESAERNRDEIPDNDEINRILYRGDDEMRVFTNLDSEILKESGSRSRLMNESEVPSWVVEGSNQAHAEASDSKSSNLVLEGKRKRKEIFYGDVLTETQWDRLRDRDATEQEIQDAIRKQREKNELKKLLLKKKKELEQRIANEEEKQRNNNSKKLMLRLGHASRHKKNDDKDGEDEPPKKKSKRLVLKFSLSKKK